LAITDAGLVVGTITIEYSSTVPSGYLISQSLEAGIEVGEGTTVDLVVSAGPQMTASPNVIGLSQTDAQATITDTGLLIGTVTMQYSSTVPVGYVMSQNPVPGTYLPMGSVVDVLVSSGPRS
jgi:beta-lactam-binding protein with PASTA domain